MAGWQEFTGLNRGYVLELYERYRRDPAAVDAETRALFERWTPPAELDASPRRRSAPEGRRRRQPGAVHPHVRPPRGAARSARQPRRLGDPSLLAGNARRHRRRSAQRCRRADLGRRSPTARRPCSTSSTRSGGSTARRRATTTRTCSCRRSATGCARRPKAGRFRAPADPINPVALLDRLTAGRGVRALPPPHVPRQDALLDRGARHARADPRRGDRRSRRRRASATS